MKYKITGPHAICGHQPGATVTADDLTDSNIDHLIAAGHLQPAKAGKPAPTTEADEAEITQED
jgi:hypothetical protein